MKFAEKMKILASKSYTRKEKEYQKSIKYEYNCIKQRIIYEANDGKMSYVIMDYFLKKYSSKIQKIVSMLKNDGFKVEIELDTLSLNEYVEIMKVTIFWGDN